MIARHPGVESLTFSIKVRFDNDDNEYEVQLNLHEMHRLVVSGELPVAVKVQRDAIEADQEEVEEATEE